MNKLICVFVLLISWPALASQNIVLIGAPGSGKGTLAAKLKEAFLLPHISSGDIVREQIANGTDFGKKVAELTKSGKLLPDTPEYMGHLVDLLQQRLQAPDCAEGFILDGFPRTYFQSQELDRIMKNMGRRIDVAVLLDVQKETVVKRLSDRTVCPNCKLSYNKTNHAPKVEGTCDACGTELIVRDDDKPEVVLARFETYEREITPVLNYYTAQQQLFRIDGEAADAELEFSRLAARLEEDYPRAYLQERIPTFPHPEKPGIKMYNLVEMYKDPGVVQSIVYDFLDVIKKIKPDYIAAPEARALPIFGALIYETGVPGIFIRKAGKIPPTAPRLQVSYATAYSKESIEMTADPSLNGKTVILIDDGIASGGTTAATVELLEKAGMKVIKILAAIRYHYRQPCEEFLSKGLEQKTQTSFDLN